MFGMNEDVIEINQFTVHCCREWKHKGTQGLLASALHQPDPILALLDPRSRNNVTTEAAPVKLSIECFEDTAIKDSPLFPPRPHQCTLDLTRGGGGLRKVCFKRIVYSTWSAGI